MEWNEALECAFCGRPLGDTAAVIARSDGSTVRVCDSCAAQYDPDLLPGEQQGGESLAHSESASSRGAQTVSDFGAAIEAAKSLLAFLERLAPGVNDLHASLLEAENKLLALEADMARLKERLRNAEELLARAPSQPTQEVKQEIKQETQEAPSQYEDLGQAWKHAGFTADDVRLVQRYFAESSAVEKMRAVRRSLGKPVVNLHPIPGDRHRVMVTLAWEIVWYQYLVELGSDVPDEERCALFAEGMELEELAPHFRVANAALDEGGRVDASELELSLLAEPPELLSELPPDKLAAIDDATEEIWNKRGQPEFRWDD